MRHRRSSSSSSSPERRKPNRRRRSRSISSSPPRRPSHKSKRHSSSSSSSDSDRNSKNRKRSSRSRSPLSRTSKEQVLRNLEKEERSNLRFEFKEDIDDLYKKDRSKEMSSIKEDGGGFRPQQFKSSRTSRFKQEPDKKSDTQPESVIFGAPTVSNRPTSSVKDTKSANMSMIMEQSLLDKRYFEDISAREQRWYNKWLELVK